MGSVNEFYPEIKQFHVFVALLSGATFAVRGALVLAGAAWPLAPPVRWLSYAIDTALLTAALMLLTILPWAAFSNGWLLVKVTLVVVYVALAVLALRRGRTRRQRAVCYALALLVFAFIYSIARAHHPLGALVMQG